MSSDIHISDSEEEAPELTELLLDQLQENYKNVQLINKQKKLIKDLQPDNSIYNLEPRKTRDRGFYQRHLYSTDLSEYLNLATRSKLELLSKNGISDEEILRMLNRKFVKLRRFFEKHDIKKHRFKKKSFSLYLEDFRKFQYKKTAGYYQELDNYIESSSDRKEFKKLLSMELEDVETTDEEPEPEPEPEPEQEELDELDEDQAGSDKQKVPEMRNFKDSIDEILGQNEDSDIDDSEEVTGIDSMDINKPIGTLIGKNNNKLKKLTLKRKLKPSANLIEEKQIKDLSFRNKDISIFDIESPEHSQDEKNEIESENENSLPTDGIEDGVNLPKKRKWHPNLNSSQSITTDSVNNKANTDVKSKKKKKASTSSLERVTGDYNNENNNIDLLDVLPSSPVDGKDLFDLVFEKDLNEVDETAHNEQDDSVSETLLNEEELETMGNTRDNWRRTRRHKFSQDHVYVTDTAVHLGLTSIYKLNDMYQDGSSYRQILDYLEDCYQKKRKERERKDIGYGPYFKPTFSSCISHEFNVLQEDEVEIQKVKNKEKQRKDQDSYNFVESDDFLSLDEEYKDGTAPPQDSNTQAVLDQQHTISNEYRSNLIGQGGKVTDTNDQGDDDKGLNNNTISGNPEDEDGFMYRKKYYKKSNALKGILPASFFKLNQNKATTVKKAKTYKERVSKPGLIRRKKMIKQIDPNDEELKTFVAPDNIEGNFMDDNPIYEVTENNNTNDDETDIFSITDPPLNEERSSSSTSAIFRNDSVPIIDLADSSDGLSDPEIENDSYEQDNGVGIEDYYKIADILKSGGNREVEEDRSSGINYMLSSSSANKKTKKTTVVGPNARRSHSNGNKKNRFIGSVVPTLGSLKSLSMKSSYHRDLSNTNPNSLIQKPLRNHITVNHADLPTTSNRINQNDHLSLREKTNVTNNSINRKPNAPSSSNSMTPSSGASKQFQTHFQRQLTPNKQHTSDGGNNENRPMNIPKKNDNTVSMSLKSSYNRQRSLLDDDKFYFHRERISGTAQLEFEEANRSEQSNYQQNDVTPSPIARPDIFQEKVIDLTRRAEVDSNLTPLRVVEEFPTLETFSNFSLPPTSFVHSKLFEFCVSTDNDGSYYKTGDIIFELPNFHFEVLPNNMSNVARMTDKLFQSIFEILLKKESIGSKTHHLIRKCYIRLIQLTWNLKRSESELLKFTKVVTKYSKVLLDICGKSMCRDRYGILYLPFHQLLHSLFYKIMRNNADLIVWETLIQNLEKKILYLLCKMTPSQLIECLEGKQGSKYYFDSFVVFTTLSRNPWNHMAEISRGSNMKVQHILNVLYLLNSRSPVLVDWEVFYQEIELLKEKKLEPHLWTYLFRSIYRIMKDFQWNFEEQLLIRLYRVLSAVRFEDVGGRSTATWTMTTLPSAVFNDNDGCLIMYFRLLVQYVRFHLDPSRQNSLLEKITPIGDFSTYSLDQLKNRFNIFLMMAMLFNKEFSNHFNQILKGIYHFKSPQSQVILTEAVVSICSVFLNEFDSIPIKLVIPFLSRIVMALNSEKLNPSITKINFLLSSVFNSISFKLSSGVNISEKLIYSCLHVLSATIKLHIPDSNLLSNQLKSKQLSILDTIVANFASQSLKSNRISLIVKNEIIPSIKSHISNNINGDVDKLVSTWLSLLLYLGTDVETIVRIDWSYFVTSEIREKNEVKFFGLLLTKVPDSLMNDFIQEKVLEIILNSLPKKISPGLFSLILTFSKSEYGLNFLRYKDGSHPALTDLKTFKQQKKQVTIKFLARIIIVGKLKSDTRKTTRLLNIFYNSLDKEYWEGKEGALDYTDVRDYTSSVMRYLNTMASEYFRQTPKFIGLVRELSIEQSVLPLNERLESASNMKELIIMLENEVINTSIHLNLREVAESLPGILEDSLDIDSISPVGSGDQSTPVYILSLIASIHLKLLDDDKLHIFYANFWLNLLIKIVIIRKSIPYNEAFYLVKLLKLARLLEYSSPVNKCLNSTVLQLFNVVEMAFIGFDDHQFFLDVKDTFLNNSTREYQGDISIEESSLYMNEIKQLYDTSSLIISRSMVNPSFVDQVENYKYDTYVATGVTYSENYQYESDLIPFII
ncbi:hypothetical protein B5S31_g3821 [[Candida] boidinii]|nr:hypothetical protein B5S31_g3821 [[Candida] boidinii]